MEVKNQQHILLIEALNNAIAETTKLQVKGNNVPFKANLGGFLQEVMTAARSLLSTIVDAQPLSENQQCNGNLSATQDDRDLRREVTNMSTELKEIKALLVKAPQTWSQVVTNGERTETQGPGMASGRFHLGTSSKPTWTMSVSGLWRAQTDPKYWDKVDTDLDLSVFGIFKSDADSTVRY